MNIQQDYLKWNIRIFLFGRIGMLGIIITAVFRLWQENGMSFAQILLLQGLFGLMKLIFEYPSGVMADYLERKYVMIISFLAMAVGSIVYMLSNSFIDFLIAEAFFGLALASRSGTDTAFVYDSILAANQKERIKQVLSNGSIIMMLTAAAAMAVGSFLEQYGKDLPFVTVVVYCFVASILYFRAKEPDRVRSDSMNSIVGDSVKLFANPVFIRVLLLFGIQAIVLRIAFWAYIPKLQVIGLADQYHGFVLAVANIVAAIIAMWYGRSKEDSKWLISIISFSSIFGIILFIVPPSFLVVFIAIGFHQIARGIISPYISVVLNKEVSSDYRASAESLRGVSIDAIFLIISGIFSLLMIEEVEILRINLILLMLIIVGIMISYRVEIRSTTSSISKGINQAFGR